MAEGGKVTYQRLGNSGLHVSNICLGGMTFGRKEGTFFDWYFAAPKQLDEAGSMQLLDRYVELGGNFVDTADMYAGGVSESIIGNWLQKRQNRGAMVIATKVFMPTSDVTNPNGKGLGRRHIMSACDNSLRRLQTDYIDLYQAHFWDHTTPIQETLRAFDNLVRSGKIRYYGFCNVCGYQLQKVVETARRLNLNPPICLQQQYNLLRRHSELEEFQVCKNEGLGVLTWSPLKGGLLTGKFKRGETPKQDGSRAGYTHAMESKGLGDLTAEWTQFSDNDQYWNIMEALERIAKGHGKTVAQVSIRWLLQKDVVTSVIIGATSLTQLESNMAAATGWELTSAEMEELDKLSHRKLTYPYDLILSFFQQQ